LLAIVAALAERARAWPAAGHVLLGAFGAIALPLLVYSVVGAALGGQGLSRAGRPLMAFGASPTRIAASTLAVTMLVSTFLCAVLSSIVAALAHGPSDPPLIRDLWTSAWVGGLGGASYAAFFVFGSALLKNGIGRGILLAIDWIFGSGAGTSAIVTPRAHLQSLFGGPPAFDLSQRASTTMLLLCAAFFSVATLLLARRHRAS
jgi:hypothetical protein